MVDGARRFIEKYGMLSDTKTVLCALSGGADSMALLEVMSELKAVFGYELYAAHFNHKLRGLESDRDEAFVRAWCEKKGVRLFAAGGDVAYAAKILGEGIEQTARRLRYDFFQRTIIELGGGKIATAHTANDNLETMIMRLARGASLSGLAGIPPVRDNIIRPILFAVRADIERFLEERGIEYVTDSTNADTKYTRNLIRHEVIPALMKINPKAPEAALAAAERLRADEGYIARAANETPLRHDGFKISAAAADVITPVVGGRVVLKMLGLLDAPLYQITSAHIDSITNLCGGSSGSVYLDLPGGYRAKREYDRLFIERVPSPNTIGVFIQRKIEPDSTCYFGNYKISAKLAQNSGYSSKSVNIFAINYDIISGTLAVRERREGDSIRLPKRPRKTLKKLFIEARIPRAERESIPVIDCAAEVVAVCGIGVDEKYLPVNNCRVLLINIELM